MNRLRKVRFKLKKVAEGFVKENKTPSIRILRVKGSNRDNKIIFINSIIMGKKGTNSNLTLTLSPSCAKYLLSYLIKELKKFEGEEKNENTIRELSCMD